MFTKIGSFLPSQSKPLKTIESQNVQEVFFKSVFQHLEIKGNGKQQIVMVINLLVQETSIEMRVHVKKAGQYLLIFGTQNWRTKQKVPIWLALMLSRF